MIPFIENEVVNKNNWISNEDMLNIIVVAETTPGPISVNMATFIGYKLKGIFGAFIATLGVCLPSFLIILAISSYYDEIFKIKALNNALSGIKAGVVFLIIIAVLKLIKKVKWNKFFIFVFLISLCLIFIFKLSIILTLIIMITINSIYNIVKLKKESE